MPPGSGPNKQTLYAKALRAQLSLRRTRARIRFTGAEGQTLDPTLDPISPIFSGIIKHCSAHRDAGRPTKSTSLETLSDDVGLTYAISKTGAS
jgi:hypothetical protein